MAKGKKTGGRDFKKGNPGGGQKKGFFKMLPKEFQDKSIETKKQIIEAYSRFSGMSRKQIEAIRPETLIEAVILKVLLDAAKSGKIDQLSRVWAECHGTPKQSVDLKTSFTLADYIAQMTDDELDAAISNFLK